MVCNSSWLPASNALEQSSRTLSSKRLFMKWTKFHPNGVAGYVRYCTHCTAASGNEGESKLSKFRPCSYAAVAAHRAWCTGGCVLAQLRFEITYAKATIITTMEIIRAMGLQRGFASMNY